MRAPFVMMLVVAGLPALVGVSGKARAETLAQSIAPQTTTVLPPVGEPSAFTPAPVPGFTVSDGTPANRAGSADDAGPIDATPGASGQSPGLSTGPGARVVRQTDPTGYVASSGGY